MHPVTLETVQHYAVASGMMVSDLDFSSVETAEEFVALVTGAEGKAKWLGATSGRTTISENRQTWSPDHNGLRMPYKGSLYLDTAEPSIKATLVEMTPANIKLASGGADIEGEGTTAIKITPRASFSDEDYISNVTWFTNYGTKGIIGATIKNALCTTGMSWSVDDKKVATCDVEFRAHADAPGFSDTLPIEYFIYLNQAAQAAAASDKGEGQAAQA